MAWFERQERDSVYGRGGLKERFSRFLPLHQKLKSPSFGNLLAGIGDRHPVVSARALSFFCSYYAQWPGLRVAGTKAGGLP